MLILVSYLWAAIGAALVYRVLAADQRARLAAVEAGDLEAMTRSVEPATGAVMCCLALFAAPAVLGWARGLRGCAEGLGILAIAAVGNTMTIAAIAVAHVI